MKNILNDVNTLQLEKIIEELSLNACPFPSLSTGIKGTWENFSGETEDILLYGQINWKKGTFSKPEAWPVLRTDALRKIAKNPNFKSLSRKEAILSCIIENPKGWINNNVFLHALLPETYTVFSNAPSLLKAFLDEHGEDKFRRIFKDEFTILSSGSNDIKLLLKLQSKEVTERKGILFWGKGLLTWGEEPETCIQNILFVSSKLEDIHSSSEVKELPCCKVDDHRTLWETIHHIRNKISSDVNHPVLVHYIQTQGKSDSSNNERFLECLKDSTLHKALAGRLITQTVNQENIKGSSTLAIPTLSNKEYHLIYEPQVGLFSIGTDLEEIRYTNQLFRMVKDTIGLSQELLPDAIQKENSDALADDPTIELSSPPSYAFTGEIGLVTGAASGIGKACAKALLDRGTVVVGLDINPKIETTFKHPNYMGIVCDISDQANIHQALEVMIQKFGGLDILVLNAGLFPKGCNIEKINLDEFSKVLNINLTSNLILLHETYPLLKQAPRYGRVVIVGSKNVKAPGPGAVAYSSSKAGLVQMGRVAAMEWAQDGIRVNIIHPDAVFDTALYTPAVLEARAAYYGISVEEYKKRNLLKTEITSDIIGEMVAEMCGELFKATTGIQLQVDGGNDRTI